jgi:hypothetical protein
VIPITEESIARATTAFDQIAAEIEGRVVDEAAQGSIRATWPPTCNEPETCIACDFKFFCPRPATPPDALAAAAALADDDDT